MSFPRPPARLAKVLIRVAAIAAVVFVFASGRAFAQQQKEPLAADATDSARLAHGRHLFEYGDCKRVVATLSDLTLPQRLERPSDLVDAHRMLGICYVQLGQPDAASRELKSVLFLEPDHALDPFETPPEVMVLFERLKAELAAKLAEIRALRQKPAPAAPRPSIVVERNTRVLVREPAEIFVPFGFAQFRAGQPTKGIILGSLQGAGLLTAIVAGVTAVTLVNNSLSSMSLPAKLSTPGIPFATDTETNAFAAAQVTLVTSAALAAVVYAYGLADGAASFEEEQILGTESQTRPLDPPAEESE